MNSKERFQATMAYGLPDRVPYFEEGIREDVLEAWYQQGLSSQIDLSHLFPGDRREEVLLDLDPRPEPCRWPSSQADLGEFADSLNPDDDARLPKGWKERYRESLDAVVMLRVHRGFFISMGVNDWDRFSQVITMLIEAPSLVRELMGIQGRFAAQLAERFLRDVAVDAIIFSEPIGGNHGSLISPKMYESFVLSSYQPLFDVLGKYGVKNVIWRTYANARVLIPSILKWGFNCLWACECDTNAMDYADLRQEFGKDLRLIGGIDLDVLRLDKGAIQQEVLQVVPPLLADGGYVPLADGRVRADVPLENYLFYRQLLADVIQG
jgi:hypothetical protein